MAGLRNLVLGAGLLAAGCDDGKKGDKTPASLEDFQAVAGHLKGVSQSPGAIERKGFGWNTHEPGNYEALHPQFAVVMEEIEADAGVADGGVPDAMVDAEPDSGVVARVDERYIIEVDPNTQPYSSDGVRLMTLEGEKIDCRSLAFPRTENDGLTMDSCLISTPIAQTAYAVDQVLVVAERDTVIMQIANFPEALPSEKTLTQDVELTADDCRDRVNNMSIDVQTCQAVFAELLDSMRGIMELQPTPEMTEAYAYYKNLLEIIKSFSSAQPSDTKCDSPIDNKFFTCEPIDDQMQLGPVIEMDNGDKLQCAVSERFLSTGANPDGEGLMGDWKIVKLNCFMTKGDDMLDIRMKFANIVGEDVGIFIDVSRNGSLEATMSTAGTDCSFRISKEGSNMPTFATVRGGSPCGSLLSLFSHFTSEASKVPLSNQ